MSTKDESVKRQLGGKGFQNNPQNINREGGPPKTHWWSELIKKELELESVKREKLKKKESAARALVEKAEEGDMAAIKEIGDRVQGKATIAVGTIEDDGSFKEQGIKVVLVSPEE